MQHGSRDDVFKFFKRKGLLYTSFQAAHNRTLYRKKHHMNWIKDNYKTILLWLALLAIAPLFIEVLFIANIMGAEVAFGLLLLFVKQIYENWQYRAQQLKGFLAAACQIVQSHPMCQTNIYLLHITASAVVLFFGGSIAYSILVWYPIVVSGSVLS